MKILKVALTACLALLLPLDATGAGPRESLAPENLLPRPARDYLLDGPWIYKVSQTSNNLIAEDLNGNGMVDLAVITNDKSLLELFLQRRNPGPDEDLFEKQEISLDRIIRSVAATDVNGNGRIDLVMAASPPRLVVMYQNDDGVLEAPTETALEADRLVLGDLTGDGRDDVLIFRDGSFMILERGRRELNLEPAQRFFTTGEPASAPMIIDFDGDGRNDIVYHNARNFDEIVVRLQSPEGTFPAEFRTRSAVLRNAAPLPATRRGERASIAAVQNNTRQIIQLRLSEADATTARARQLPVSAIHTIPFSRETRGRNPLAVVADVDGDGRADLVVASPALSSIRWLRQTRDGALVQSSLPSLQGIESVAVLPVERGEPAPLVFFSPEEKAVGFSRFDTESEQLPFPRILPVSGVPRGVALLTEGDNTTLALLTAADGDTPPQLMGYTIDADGNLGEGRNLLPVDEEEGSPLAGLDVVGIEAMDVNRNGREDLIVYADFRPAMILLRQEEGHFGRLEATSGVLEGLLSSTRPGSLRPVSLGGGNSSVMAVKERFVRFFHIDDEQNVVVEQQFNGRNDSTRLTTAAVGSLRGLEDKREVVLLDRGNRILTVYEATPGGTPGEPLAHIDLDDGTYASMRLLDLDGDGRDDILLTAEDRLAIIYTRPLHGPLETVANVSTPVEEGGFGRVYTREILGTPERQVVGIEMRENMMELFTPGRDEEGRPALLRFYKFKMFDADFMRGRRGGLDGSAEPRELLAIDINGDGRNEIVTLMHDNIIVYYPQ